MDRFSQHPVLPAQLIHLQGVRFLTHCVFPSSVSGHKRRHKRHKLKRRSTAGFTPVSSAVPVVSAGIFSDVESLSAGLTSDASFRSESSSGAGVRPSNDSSGDSGPHRRSKRFLSYPRFVEVMLVADSKMVEHHGSNLQHYILTLMSIVSSARGGLTATLAKDVGRASAQPRFLHPYIKWMYLSVPLGRAGGLEEGKGQPRAEVNTTFKLPGGGEGSLRRSLSGSFDEC